MADGDDVVRDFFVVEDLGYAVGLETVVVEVCIGGFGGVAETEEIEDYEGIGEGEECWNCSGPHIRVVRVAVEEHEGGNVLV